MYNKLLVAVKLDHASKSIGLMQKAIALAHSNQATIHVVAVVPEIDDNLKVLPEDSLAPLQTFVDGFDAGATRIDVSVRTGTPHRVIPKAAAELGADLILMNSHNPRMRDYLIGSTAAHVAMHAECDVLVVRQNT